MVKATQEQLAQMQAVLENLKSNDLHTRNPQRVFPEANFLNIFPIYKSSNISSEEIPAAGLLVFSLATALEESITTGELPISFKVSDNDPNTKRIAGTLGIANICLGQYNAVNTATASGTIAQGEKGILVD